MVAEEVDEELELEEDELDVALLEGACTRSRVFSIAGCLSGWSSSPTLHDVKGGSSFSAALAKANLSFFATCANSSVNPGVEHASMMTRSHGRILITLLCLLTVSVPNSLFLVGGVLVKSRQLCHQVRTQCRELLLEGLLRLRDERSLLLQGFVETIEFAFTVLGQDIDLRVKSRP